MTKFCSACKQIKPRHLFKRTSSYCGPCASSYGKNLYRLKKSHSALKTILAGYVVGQKIRLPTATDTTTGHKKTPWRIDHCHSTGVFRRFLCRNSNTCLGAFRDRPLILIRAAFYLVKNRIWICTYTSFNRLKLLGIAG